MNLLLILLSYTLAVATYDPIILFEATVGSSASDEYGRIFQTSEGSLLILGDANQDS